jgi:hypothetical protein
MASVARDIRFDPAKLVHEDGTPKRLRELDENTRLALRGYEYEETVSGKGKNRKIVRRFKAKFPEKTAAREQAMKHLGLFKGDNQQKPAGVQVHVEGYRSVEFDPIPLQGDSS